MGWANVCIFFIQLKRSIRYGFALSRHWIWGLENHISYQITLPWPKIPNKVTPKACGMICTGQTCEFYPAVPN